MDYKEKYFKYKGKYLNLKSKLEGGLIGDIPKDKLLETKEKYEIPSKINNYVKLITVPDSNIIRVGSSMNRIQPYFSDVDIMNIVEKNISSEDLITFFIQHMKKIIQNIKNTPNTFFSDFKAGGLHWTIEQIMNESNNNMSLREAIKIKDVVKIDIIGPYDERYLEMSTFFVLKSNEGFINTNEDYFASLQESLKSDILELKTIKPFKAVKRTWSLARINKDIVTLNKLKEIVKSNIALLAQINADIETVVLLLEHDSNYDTEFIINEFNTFKEKISSIVDINIDEQKTSVMINYIVTLFGTNRNNNELKQNLLDMLDQLHEYLQNIINKETLDYLKHIGFSFYGDDTILDKIKKIF